jgi:hypothetical protein
VIDDGDSSAASQTPSPDNSSAADLAPTASEAAASRLDEPPPSQKGMPMLDVHAPHQVVHTWKDFFIHIATIAIGLLIAIGLEQTVEFFHHRHQLQEARKQLSVELDANRQVLQKNLDCIGAIQNELDRDVALIREYQASHTPMKGTLNYSHGCIFRPRDAAWLSVKQNGALDLMPYDEMENHNYLYELLGDLMDSVVGFTSPIEIAAAIGKRSPDGSLAQQDIEALVTATSEAQGKVAITAMLLGIEGRELQKRGASSQKPE